MVGIIFGESWVYGAVDLGQLEAWEPLLPPRLGTDSLVSEIKVFTSVRLPSRTENFHERHSHGPVELNGYPTQVVIHSH